MKKWQYLLITLARPVASETLNVHGREGWELVSVSTDQDAKQDTFYFKRPDTQPATKHVTRPAYT